MPEKKKKQTPVDLASPGFLTLLQKEIALAANPAKNVAAANTTRTNWRGEADAAVRADPKNRAALARETRKQESATMTAKRKEQDRAERAIWEAEDVYRQSDPAIGRLSREGRASAAAQVPVSRETETTGNLARSGIYAQQTGPTLKQLAELQNIAKQAALQPSIRDNPLRQAQKTSLRGGPFASLPIAPLLQALAHTVLPESEPDPTIATNYARGLLADAQKTQAGQGLAGGAVTYGSMLNSMAGDMVLAGPVMRATGLAKPGHQLAGAASEVATRQIAPRLAEIGMEQMGRTATRALPKLAETGYEAGTHAPIWGAEKLLHQAPALAGAVPATVGIADALRQLGIRLPISPETIRRGQ
jgi:hypothetical protein